MNKNYDSLKKYINSDNLKNIDEFKIKV